MTSSRNLNGDGNKQISPFAEMVYRVVSKIPSGEVRTYGWVAVRIGRPRAARAVGQALKRNPRLIQVPCHRVVRADGKIGGYVGGVQRKVELLTKEGAIRPSART